MQQTLILLWKKYGSVSYSFSCTSKSVSSNEKLRKSHFYTESFQSSSTIRGSGFSYKFQIIKTSNNSFTGNWQVHNLEKIHFLQYFIQKCEIYSTQQFTLSCRISVHIFNMKMVSKIYRSQWKKLKISSISPKNNQLFESKCQKIVQNLFLFLVSEQFVFRNWTKQRKSVVLFWGNWGNNVIFWFWTTCIVMIL